LHAIFGPNSKPSGALLADFWSVISENDGHRRMPKLLHYLHERQQNPGPVGEAWIKAGVPIRLLTGGSDPVAAPDFVRSYRERIPGADRRHHPRRRSLPSPGSS